jgi:hypothetical protein
LQRRIEALEGKPGGDILGLAPRPGMMRDDSTEASAGTRLSGLSVCQSWFALFSKASR